MDFLSSGLDIYFFLTYEKMPTLAEFQAFDKNQYMTRIHHYINRQFQSH